ncbi:MAG: PatB family C-S lyase [Sedimentisphaerales bacterium]|nr:PatB family C-S lyase [Sedimentisphaerales bacterium]
MSGQYDFDKAPDRRGTDSLKWGRYRGRDVIPMWVADMDFVSAPPILEALHKRIEHAVFGYALAPAGLPDIVVQWCREHYDWTIRPEWIVWLPGLVPALHLMCRAFGQGGDEVIVFTPVYPPFLSAPKRTDRRLICCPLREEKGQYTLDLEAFRNRITPRTKVLLLCNPHNPVGAVFPPDMLESLARICIENRILICSDEIHCDLILDPVRHKPIASIHEEIAACTVTLMSPAKTFNLPGLNCGLAIIPNADLRRRFAQARAGIVPHVNALGYAACLAAYRDCEPWRQELLAYLRSNRDRVVKTVKETPGLSMIAPSATYLAWIDVRALDLPEPAAFFEQAGVGLQDGNEFDGPGFVRLNFGCPQSRLKEGLHRIQSALTKV